VKTYSFFSDQESSTPLFLHPVQAGFPSPADDFIERRIDLNEHLVTRPASTFFVRVEGKSMVDANIHPGDILVVDRSITPVDRKIIVAVLHSEFTVKRIRMVDGKVFLEAANPAFKPIAIDADSDFQVWGVVTYIIHKA
jgi:DNA polymerase V